MRRVIFEGEGFDQFTKWGSENPKLFQKIVRLIKETAREPFTGISKPEPLRNELRGYWSRRITDEHRLVYRVTDDSIVIIQCRDHY